MRIFWRHRQDTAAVIRSDSESDFGELLTAYHPAVVLTLPPLDRTLSSLHTGCLMWSASPTPPRNQLSLSLEAPIGSFDPLPPSPIEADDHDYLTLTKDFEKASLTHLLRPTKPPSVFPPLYHLHQRREVSRSSGKMVDYRRNGAGPKVELLF